MSKMLLVQQGKGGQGLTFSDGFCEEQAFDHFFLTVKSGYNSPRDILISSARYFNWRFLNFNQYFASDADYIFLPGLSMSNTTYVQQ